MSINNPFKWRHFEGSLIVLCVRWYLRYGLSYRDLGEMMLDRGLSVAHTTIYRWVQRYAPEIDKRCRAHLKTTTDSWRVDETYIKVRGAWKYLYRAVDSAGNTLDFLLTAKRDAKAAKRFLAKALKATHTSPPRVINVDKHAAYPLAFTELQEEGPLPQKTTLRQCKYLNNVVEQDHRRVKRLTRPMLGFQSFHTAHRTLRGIEVLSMIRKGQIRDVPRGDIVAQNAFIDQLFGLAA
jgi:transposase-like protein